MSSATLAQVVESLRRRCACAFLLCFRCLQYVLHFLLFCEYCGPGSGPARARPRPDLGPPSGRGGRRNALAGDVVGIILALPHAAHIDSDEFVGGLGGVAAHEFHNRGPVCGESVWLSWICFLFCRVSYVGHRSHFGSSHFGSSR